MPRSKIELVGVSHATVPREQPSVRYHKFTGGILKPFPKPVDPVGNAPNHLSSNTVALFLNHSLLSNLS